MKSVSVFKKGDARRVKSPWCCRWSEYVDGKMRKRERHFATRGEADEHAAGLADDAKLGKRHYSDVELREIDHVWSLCSDQDLPLLDVVRAGLESLVSDFGVERRVPTIRWAIEMFYDEGKARNLRPVTMKNRHVVLDPFMVGREDRLIGTLTTEEILSYILSKYGVEGSRDSLLGILRAFYNWCAAKGQEWVPPMAPKALNWTKSKQDGVRPLVYTAAEAEGIIRALPDYLKATAAVAFFAGVRPLELRRMYWGWTDDRGDWFGIDMARRKIELSGQWTKGRVPRTLHDLPDNLWPWLERFPGSGILMPLTERNWYRNIDKAKRDAGIKKIGNDMMRHTFGSHGRHRGLDWTIDVLGHTGGLAIFNEHYNNNSIGPEDAEEYFSIVPG